MQEWNDFVNKSCKKTAQNGRELTASEIIDELRRDVAADSIRDEVACQMASRGHDLDKPLGSIRSWLAGTDDDSRRREEEPDQHATRHSSESKTPILTTADQFGGALSPTLGPKSFLGPTMERSKPLAISGLGGISTVGKSEWIEIEITVDSGACETVMPAGICHSIGILASKQYVEGVEYEVANGETIPNLGERRCLMMTQGSGVCKKITFQVADVHLSLIHI